jgi:PleD family two-component response regulator
MKKLDQVFTIDPENASAVSMRKRLRMQLSVLQRQNGHSEGNGGESAKARKRRKGIVLIIDHDERILVRLSETFRKYGLEAVSACNSAEAHDTLGSISPDLILSEINFKEVSGV